VAGNVEASEDASRWPSATGPLKIVYASALSERDSSQYRAWALQRLGHTVTTLNAYPYESSNALVRKLTYRAVMGPAVRRFNRDVLAMVERDRPDIFWADKLLWLWPETLRKIRSLGVASVSYMIDNPFGTRQDPGWRVYMKAIPEFDLHVVQRDSNFADYRARGARDVIKVQTAYEPTLHFPPPAGWSDADRTIDVGFIGSPYDERAAFLTRLARECSMNVRIHGSNAWLQALDAEAQRDLFAGNELYLAAYREGIWSTKINLSFLTHANQDEFVHKSFEIAACEGFLLAERSAGHAMRFIEDEEAVFFADFEECVAKIRRYLPDEAARTRIARAGRLRAERDGYHNDAQVAKILERLHGIVTEMRHKAGVSG
jgi:spore maturation protein CgeB